MTSVTSLTWLTWWLVMHVTQFTATSSNNIHWTIGSHTNDISKVTWTSVTSRWLMMNDLWCMSLRRVCHPEMSAGELHWNQFWLVVSDDTNITASDWSWVITWPGYWSLIGREWSRDTNITAWHPTADSSQWAVRHHPVRAQSGEKRSMFYDSGLNDEIWLIS